MAIPPRKAAPAPKPPPAPVEEVDYEDVEMDGDPSEDVIESEDIDDLIDSVTPEMLQNQQRMSARVDSSGVTYKWKDGINRIRLLPAKKGVGYSYFAARQHWLNMPSDDGGKPKAKSFLCIAPTGKVCPICEYAAEVMSDPQTVDEGKRMESRPVFIYNVLNMLDPDSGPKVAFFGWESHKSISELWDAGEDPTDYQNGPIFQVKRENRGRVTYTTTALSARFPVPVSVLKSLHDLRKYAAIPSVEALGNAIATVTGALPPGQSAGYKPGMPAVRQAIGSRAPAASQTTVAPPRRNVSAMLRDSE